MLKILKAITGDEISIVHTLFLEYAQSLNFDLCFQNFSEELASLPGEYASPEGLLLLAYYDGKPAGCIALRKIEDADSAGQSICEMKRLYVRNEFRGKNIGKALAEEIIYEARKIGYNKMRLDTVPIMETAIKLYEKLGFYKIEPYRDNPVPGALYMELDLL